MLYNVSENRQRENYVLSRYFRTASQALSTAFALLLAFSAQALAVPSFIVHTDTRLTRPYCVSNTGWVAGATKAGTSCAKPFGGAGSGRSNPFVTNDSLFNFSPSCQPEVVPDGSFAAATAVNDSGWVVGVDATSRGFRFKNNIGSATHRSFLARADTVVFFGTLNGSSTTIFQDINTKGKIAGTNGISQPGGGFQSHAALFNSDVTSVRDLGTLAGGNTSHAYGINNLDFVVGTSKKRVSEFLLVDHAFIWRGAGSMIDLGVLPGDTLSAAYAINDNGVAVGVSWRSSSSPLTATSGARAVMWDGGMTVLEVWPGAFVSVAYDINILGEIVGQIRDADGLHAALWLPQDNYGLAAGLHKLTDVIHANSAVNANSTLLRLATSISDNGVITCVGRGSGLSIDWGFVLTRPTTVNSASDEGDADLNDRKCETGTPGECTLRAALQNANLTRRLSYIVFDIPGGGSGGPVIQLQSPLPPVTGDAILNGSTQPGSGMVNLDGSLLVDTSVSGLLMSGFNPRVRGFGVGNFPGNGITIGPSPGFFDEDYSAIIEDCRIGVAPDGESDWGNAGYGILSINSDNDVTIGDGSSFGFDPSSNGLPHGNVIANNGKAGVFTDDVISIRGNEIYNNGGMGIDIAPEGPNINVAGQRNNYPQIDSVRVSGGRATAYGIIGRGVFQSPNFFGWTRIIELYINFECDPSGFGEGRFLWVTDSLNFDPDGFARFAIEFTEPIVDRWFVSATMSDNSRTSEFSPCAAPPIVVNSVADIGDLSPDDSVCWTGNFLPGGGPECTFRAALETANILAGPDEISFDIDVAGIPVIKPLTALPDITEGVKIIGATQPSAGTVELDGSSIPFDFTQPIVNGLTLKSSGSEISGLYINKFPGNGIVIDSGSINFIHSNTIGTGSQGLIDKGNALSGILITGNSRLNEIGGKNSNGAMKTNFIAFNGVAGIFIEDGTFTNIIENSIFSNSDAGIFIANGDRNTILGNSIVDNGGLGIDLAPLGVTVSDSLDLDTGPNGLVNSPFITRIIVDTNSAGVEISTTVRGIVDAAPSASYVIEFFENLDCDESTYGEGMIFQKSLSSVVITDATGFGQFSVTSTEFIYDFDRTLTATATDGDGNTSEFSPCYIGPIVVNSDGDAPDLNQSDGECWTGVTLPNGEKECTFRAAIETSNAGPNFAQIEFNIQTADPLAPIIIQPLTRLPEITDAVSILGESQPDGKKILLNGADVIFAFEVDGLTISAGRCDISGITIGGFSGNGIVLKNRGSNYIQNVTIGVGGGELDIFDQGNALHGIYIIESSENVIGSDADLAQPQDSLVGNRIAENGASGVFVESGDDNKIQGNEIIGNGGSGVFLQSGNGNMIIGNSLASNVGLGIDLAPSGFNKNDATDADTGPNGLLNHPFIDTIAVDTPSLGPIGTYVFGSVAGSPLTGFLAEIFSNESCDSLGSGEGNVSLGIAFAQTGPDGLGGFRFLLDPSIVVSETFFSVTLTDVEGNTSEFSPCWPQLKKLQIRDHNGVPIALKDFDVSHVAFDVPTYTETPYGTFTTDEEGIIDLTSLLSSGELEVGDSIKVTKVLREGGGPFLESSITLDNRYLDPTSFNPIFDELTYDTLQEIIVNHTTVGFSITIAIEWDATRAYIDSVISGMRMVGNYLYDVFDGQVRLDTVRIREDIRRELVDDPTPEFRADILIVANNVEYPLYSSDYELVLMPRRGFGASTSEARNLSAAEDVTNPADILHWRKVAQLLAKHIFGFYRESNLEARNAGCDVSNDMGFMGWPYPRNGDDGANSEMSWSRNYNNAACRLTKQFQFNGVSCWDHFKNSFEGNVPDDAGVFAPITLPIQHGLPDGVNYFAGPNESDPQTGEMTLNYDVGSRMTFNVNNVVSPAFEEKWTMTDIDGAKLANVEVEFFRGTGVDEFKVKQGRTSDDGEIWLIGLNDGDAVSASGSQFIAFADSTGVVGRIYRWVNGAMVVSGGNQRSSSPTVQTLVMSPITGDFPLIVSAELDSASFVLQMDVKRVFDSLPSMRYVKDSAGLFREELTLNNSQYQGVVDLRNVVQGALEINAVDDSLKPFFFDINYRLSANVDLQSAKSAVSADATAEFDLDTTNSSIEKMLVVSSSFPIARANLNTRSIQAGQTHSLSVYPVIGLQGANTLTMNYNPGDLSGSGLFTERQSIKIHRWNPASQQWDALASNVDEEQRQVTAPITETGVYAAFTTDFQTDVDDDEVVTLPTKFMLHQNYPNPFNPSTIISYDLPVKANVTIAIYNVLGQRIKVFEQGPQSAGPHSVTWEATDSNGKSVASGMYFYKITAGDFQASRKMVLLK